MTTSRILIVGGGYAGALAAARAARKIGSRGEVVLVSADDSLVERVRLHEAVARGTNVRHRLDALLRGSGAKIRVGRVERIDARAGRVEVGVDSIAYDRLIFAAGSRAKSLEGDGIALDPERVGEAATRLRELAARGDGRVVVGGGGATAIELATEIAEAHPALQVHLVAPGELGERSSAKAAAHLARVLDRLRITVHRARIERVVDCAVVTSRGLLEADLALVATGFVGSPLARVSGLSEREDERVPVDPCLRATSAEGVYVVGDVALPLVDPGSPCPMGCKTAMPMAAHAVDNALRSLRGDTERAFDWRDVVLCTSLGRRDGILQPMNVDGTPRPSAIVGRAAAWGKELICRFTIAAIRFQARGIDYPWLSTGRAPAALPRAPRYLLPEARS